MRFLRTVLAVAAVLHCAGATKLSQVAPGAPRNVIYIDFKVTDWSDLTPDIRRAVDNGFNVINIAFWLARGVLDAASVWQSMSASARQGALDYAHARGAVILLSAGGATDPLIGSQIGGLGASAYCSGAANFAVSTNLDGVDFDIELEPGDQGGWTSGQARDFLVTCTSTAAGILGSNRELTHAPIAPYFGTWAGGAGTSYVAVHNAVGNSIDAYNLQYYNQGNVYLTFNEIFIAATGSSVIANTAVNQLRDQGVPYSKLVVGKPMAPQYAGSGYVDVAALGQIISQARSQLGWNGGVMTWMYEPSNIADNWGQTMRNALGTTGGTTRTTTRTQTRTTTSAATTTTGSPNPTGACQWGGCFVGTSGPCKNLANNVCYAAVNNPDDGTCWPGTTHCSAARLLSADSAPEDMSASSAGGVAGGAAVFGGAILLGGFGVRRFRKKKQQKELNQKAVSDLDYARRAGVEVSVQPNKSDDVTKPAAV